ncbi:MAG TPA: hypothetical protein VK338_02935, partial [Candidatus Nitrosocosmicus sp.]|nr:hypothetical protein [Candidatus Nitrosocosmicus sp.]
DPRVIIYVAKSQIYLLLIWLLGGLVFTLSFLFIIISGIFMIKDIVNNNFEITKSIFIAKGNI